MTTETHGVLAMFRVDQIPAGDFDVVLVTTDKEHRERVNKGDGKNLR